MVRWDAESTAFSRSFALRTGNVRWSTRDSDMAARTTLERPENCGQRDEDIELPAQCPGRILDDVLLEQQDPWKGAARISCRIWPQKNQKDRSDLPRVHFPRENLSPRSATITKSEAVRKSNWADFSTVVEINHWPNMTGRTSLAEHDWPNITGRTSLAECDWPNVTGRM